MSAKKPNVIKQLEANIGTSTFPAAYQAAREYKEEIDGWINDALKVDAERRADRPTT